MSSRRLLLVGLVLVMAVVLSACGGGDDAADTGSSASGSTTAPVTEPVDDGHADDGGHMTAEEAPEPVEGAPTVDITAVDIDFDPATMNVVAGEPTNVNVSNEGGILHDFTLEEAGVHLNLEPGEAKSAAIVIDEPGTYQAICTVPGHEDAGMTMEVVVSEG